MREGFNTPTQEDLLWQAFLKGDPETRHKHARRLFAFANPERNGSKISEKAVSYLLKLIFEPPFRYTWKDCTMAGFALCTLWEQVPPYKGSLEFIDDVLARGEGGAKGMAAEIVAELLLYRYIPILQQMVDEHDDSILPGTYKWGRMYPEDGYPIGEIEDALDTLKGARELGALEGSGLTTHLAEEILHLPDEKARRAREQVERLLGM